MNASEVTKIVDDNIKARRSIRAFLPKPVEKQEILDLLNVAARAPSGTNTQPWQVYIITGAKKQALSDEIISIFNNPEA